MRSGALAFLVLSSWALGASSAMAAESDTPFIDQIKRDLERSGKGNKASDTDYIESERARLRKAPEESFIEKQKAQNPSLREAPKTGFIEEQKARLAPKEEGGAIQAVKEGRSELEFKMDRRIKAAFGLRYGAGISHNISASNEVRANEFSDVYGSGHTPDLTLFGEYELFHSDAWGSLGLQADLGIAYNSGKGRFLNAPPGFTAESQTKFQFFTFPLVLAATYRMNLFKYVVPVFSAGPALIGYYESRNDSKKGTTGNSRGYYVSGGVLIPLGWMSKRSTEDLYYDYGVKRFGLTIEYSRLATVSGPVDFDNNGVNAGFTFEY